MDSSTTSGSKKSRLSLSRNTAILILCMGIASFLWLIVQLSQTYTGTVPISISYRNIPEKLVATYPLAEEGRGLIQSSGFRIMLAKMNFGRLGVTVDYNNYKNRQVIASRDVLKDASGDMPTGYQLLSFYPDTIYLKFEPKTSKLVPVQLLDTIKMAKQFDLKKDITLQPDSVTVFGPASIVDTLSYWPTDSLVLTDLKASLSDTLWLRNEPSLALSAEPGFVIYNIDVESYTEASIQVPVTILNAPLRVEATTYPKEVTVKFLVGLSNHEKVKAAYFEVVANLSGVDIESDQVIELTLKQHPDFIKNPTLHPEAVEYIIYR